MWRGPRTGFGRDAIVLPLHSRTHVQFLLHVTSQVAARKLICSQWNYVHSQQGNNMTMQVQPRDHGSNPILKALTCALAAFAGVKPVSAHRPFAEATALDTYAGQLPVAVRPHHLVGGLTAPHARHLQTAAEPERTTYNYSEDYVLTAACPGMTS